MKTIILIIFLEISYDYEMSRISPKVTGFLWWNWKATELISSKLQALKYPQVSWQYDFPHIVGLTEGHEWDRKFPIALRVIFQGQRAYSMFVGGFLSIS